MTERHLFVTGGAGCVGHYLLDRLLEDPRNRLHVLLRNPGKLRTDLRERVRVVPGDLAEPEGFLPMLSEMDGAVLAAASWGGQEARQVNVLTTWAILDALDPARCKRVVYFSTASLLDPGGNVLDAAGEHGTGYIRQKHEALEGISGTRTGDRVVTVFPTVVLGGGDRHPWSHASRGLREFRRYLWLLRFLRMDARFHVVQADYLARAVVFLLEGQMPSRPVVLGEPPLTVGEALRHLASEQGLRPVPQLDITPLALLLPHLLPWKFTTWDRYCLLHRDFTYPVFDLDKEIACVPSPS
ncbi:MAG: NAD(P)H-binding protein [Candidatus Sericytochromatia bacterium]|uniref:NAD(P)H-binding protein n=1 Tax=Candidatus Tanganyikabacteria bacterium TaxID=2961651 RepID=A0A937X6R9_9BACT|nr:NAD(P)H-binding protein [Candidatus Tanganyikabacteria bacterium]